MNGSFGSTPPVIYIEILISKQRKDKVLNQTDSDEKCTEIGSNLTLERDSKLETYLNRVVVKNKTFTGSAFNHLIFINFN